MTGLPELKKCPFCGGEGEVFKDKYSKYLTGCKKCKFYYGIQIQDGVPLTDGWFAIHYTPEEAIEAWNKRAAETEARAKAIDEMRNKVILHLSDWKLSETDYDVLFTIEDAINGVNEIAEQLKGGNDHEQNYQGNT